ncbi:DUF6541 family protein [Chloroflexota bacterium]
MSSLLLSFLFLTSCVTLKDPQASQEFRGHVVGILHEGQSTGQSIVSHRSRLNGVQLWLRLVERDSQDGGTLTLDLRHSIEDTQPLVSIPVSFNALESNFPITIPIPPQDDPPDQGYFITLKTNDGVIHVLGRNEDSYPKGKTFINDKPMDMDMSFRLSYNYDIGAIITDLRNSISRIWLIIPILLILWLPGYFLLSLLNPHKLQNQESTFDGGERTAISIGLSIAIIPVLLLWTSTFGIKINPITIFVFSGLLILFALWRYRFNIIQFTQRKNFPFKATDKFALTLAIIFLFSLGVRFIMVRDLVAPAWVDSVHHAVITRLIIESGSIPGSYAPYINNQTASYHPGFHSNLAFFYFLSGFEIPEAMLVYGQILNALSIFAVYLFTTSLIKDRTAGVIAALVTGVITPMPAYYTSWGRYTQLAGTLIFPVALALVLKLIQTDRKFKKRSYLHELFRENWGYLLLASIACAGLLLTHYRVSAFLACLLFAYLLTNLVRSVKDPGRWRDVLREFIIISLVGTIAILLTFPWWPATIVTLFAPQFAITGVRISAFNDFVWRYLVSALGSYALAIAILGLIWGIIRRRWFTLTLILWICILFFIANLGALSLPGRGLINNTSVQILLFMPISALCGYLMSWIIQNWEKFIPSKWITVYRCSLVIGGILIAIIGARTLIPILNPVTMLFREADYPAMDFIQENIPVEETILINPFAWGYGLFAGNDGGFWITPIAGRRTLPPPVLYGMGKSTEDGKKIPEISRQVIEYRNRPKELHAYLLAQGIHYIYIGARGGTLSPRNLRNSPFYEMLYAKDGAWLFKLDHIQ